MLTAPQLKAALGIFDYSVIMDIVSWSRKVAALALDRLVDEGLLKPEDFEAALDSAAEEIQIRLAMGDYPPVDDTQSVAT